MNDSLLAAILVLVGPLTADRAAGPSGTVVDPQDLPIAGIEIAVTCAGRAQTSTTNERGGFAFAFHAEAADCWIDIVRAGFAPVHERVAADRGDVRIQLRLAPVHETVTVAARPPAPVRPSLTTVELTHADFRQFAGNSADLVRYAAVLGGARAASVLYVDGMPAASLPPLDMIAGISVNADPFSAEFSDGDVATIRIVTRAPARTFRVTSGGDVLGLGGQNALTPAGTADSTFLNLGVRGAIPRLPITFAASANRGRVSNDVPIRAVLPMGGQADSSAVSTNRTAGGSLELYYTPRPGLRMTVSHRESHGDGSNLGVGGIVLGDAGFASAFDSRDVRATVARTGDRFSYEGGMVAAMTGSSTRANAESLGIIVGGDAILGGAALTDSRTQRTRWTAKQVVRASGNRPWAFGIVAAGSINRSQLTPNAHGSFQVDSLEAYEQAAAGQPRGTWLAMRGASDARYASLMLSPFVQKTLVRAAAVEVNGGVRGDYHGDFGAFVSPRASFAARVHGFTIGGGAGIFALPVSDAVFMRDLENDGVHLQQLIATGVSLDGIALVVPDRVPGIRTRLATNLARPRELMEKLSIERPAGRFVAGVDATWTQGRHLLGLAREADAAGWVDAFESNRSADRFRLHTQLRYTRSGHTFAAHYEWARAYDNTDGPFSFVAMGRSPADEWSRSASVAPHAISVAASFTLPKQISVSVTDTWNGGAPFNITSGLDAAGNGLFLDRGGLPRNSGDGPAFHSLSAYGNRRIALPKTVARGRVHLNLGVQADNLLDNTNYLSVGSVITSSSFGRPLAAMPGRSARVFLNVD